MAVENSVKEKAATSNNKAAKLSERLVREKAKVEQQYEHHLLQYINELRRQLSDAKLRNVQYEFIKVEQLGNCLEKVARAQKDKVQGLKMVELLEEEKLLTSQNTQFEVSLKSKLYNCFLPPFVLKTTFVLIKNSQKELREKLRLQPSKNALCESAFQIETAKEELKNLRRNLDHLRTIEAKLLDHQSLQLKNLEEFK